MRLHIKKAAPINRDSSNTRIWQLQGLMSHLTLLLVVIMSSFSSITYADDNNPSGAVKINLNQEYTGNLSSSSDVDWYQFQLPKDGNVTITLRHNEILSSNTTYWKGYLYSEKDIAKVLHVVSLKGAPKTATIQEGLPAGTYYFKVNRSSYNPAQYHLKADFKVSDFYEKTPNATAQEASLIRLNQEYTGNLSSSSDVDWYQFQLPKDGNVTITIRHNEILSSNTTYWKGYLYSEKDIAKVLHVVSLKGAPKTATIQEGLPAGTYYFKVNRSSYNPAQYHLKADFKVSDFYEKTPNGTAQEASLIRLNQEYTGNLSSSSDVDWYQFQLPKDDKVTITLRHNEILSSNTTYGKGYLYSEKDIAKVLHIVSLKGAPKTATIQEGLQAGTYYFKVNRSSYNPAQYHLQIEGPSASVLQFFATNYTINETSGKVIINVKRMSNSIGPVSVDYATSNGTATSGSDYTSISGTLNWDDGDSADKTFKINIINDNIVESDETVNLTLSNSIGAELGSPNTATLTIKDNTQCSYNITPTNSFHKDGAENGSVKVTALAGCQWTAKSNVAWAKVTDGATGSGNSTVKYSVDANTSVARNGTLSIAGKIFTINQEAKSNTNPNCNYNITPISSFHKSGAENGSVKVTALAGCQWAAKSNIAWAKVTDGATGSENGIVKYSVDANTGAARNGTLSIAEKTFTINQEAKDNTNPQANNDLILNLGSSGLWAWMNNNNWIKVKELSPQKMTIGDLDASGKDDLIVSFDKDGIWKLMNNSDWKFLDKLLPRHLVTGNLDNTKGSDLVIDFGTGKGLSVFYNNTYWKQIHELSAKYVTTGQLDSEVGDEIIVDFDGKSGLWVRWNDKNWTQLHTLSTQGFVTANLDGTGHDELVVDFGNDYGIWIRMDTGSWNQLHTLSPKQMATGDIDGNGQDDLLVNFATIPGLWLFMNNSNWVQLHSVAVEAMVTADLDANGKDELIQSLTQHGTWILWNYSTWSKFYDLTVKDFAAGNLDGISAAPN